MHASGSRTRRLAAAALVATACFAQSAAHGAPPPDPRCAGPGITGDRADLRGLRFRARRPVSVVAIGLAGSVAGLYEFDYELRQSTGFVGLAEAGTAGFAIPVPTAAAPPYATALLQLPVFAGPPPEATFTFRFVNVSGPGLLFFESYGIGSDDVCADVDETEENDVAVPTVRGDPAGFYVLGDPLALCESDGSGHTTAADHGIRFTPLGERFETIGIGLRASVPGLYGFAAQIRRSRGFTTAPERVVEFATTLGDSLEAHPYPMTFFDFEPIAVSEEDEPFTLRLVPLASPGGGVAHVEQGSSCTSAFTTADATSADPAAVAPASNFVVAVPEPVAGASAAAMLAALAAIAALRRSGARRVAIALALAGSLDASAATIAVDHLVDDETADGLCSVREALLAAYEDVAVDGCSAGNGDDLVMLPAGTLALVAPLPLGTRGGASLTLAGAGRELTVLDAGFLGRVASRTGLPDVEVRDLTMTRGRASPGQFGGCFVQGSQVRTTFRRVALVDCAVSGAADGGAIMIEGGSLTVIEGRFLDNVAARDGGAIALRQDPYDPTTAQRIERSHFENNHAGSEGGGGAISSAADSLVVTESTFWANGASSGGAIAAQHLTLERSTFEENVASYAGGAVGLAFATITNSTFTENHALTGGALFTGGEVAITHSTFVNNTRVQDLVPVGNSIHCQACSVSLRHAALAAADGANCTGNPPASLGGNFATDASCALAGDGDAVGSDPELGPLADNGGPTRTHLPAATSPLVDAAPSAGCEPIDQRGVARPQDGDGDGFADCDVGAVERVPEPDAAALAAAALAAVAAAARSRVTRRTRAGLAPGSDVDGRARAPRTSAS